MNGGIPDQSFLVSNVQKSSMIDARIVRDTSTEDFRIPSIQVRIEVYHRNWAPVIECRPKRWKRGRVIATERDDPWNRISGVIGVTSGDDLVRFAELFQSDGVVKNYERCIATVDDLCA